MTVILGIKITDKTCNSLQLQKILTKYNCIIKLRIGINNSSIFCSTTGIILLETEDSNKRIYLEKELLEINNIQIQRMIF